MSNKTVLFVHALTGLHVGSGTALGVVDLPVQRERHTDWPLIPGSSLKGVLRAACNERSGNGADSCPKVLAAFGPPTGSASDHAGAVALSDARILAFPVRSLRGVFAWVTCPGVLVRLARDLAIVGRCAALTIPKPGPNAAACPAGSPLVTGSRKMILEEFEFSCSALNPDVPEWVARHAVADQDTRERIRQHLVVLHDDDFTHFVQHATEVAARIGLDYDTKTVRSGALFYEEYVPAETLFYSLVLCRKSYSGQYPASGAAILEWLRSRQIRHLQIGGGATIGKGICRVQFAPDKANG